MPIMACPKCARNLQISDQNTGKLMRCPHCQETFTAPTAFSAKPLSMPPPLPRPLVRSEEEGELERRPRRRRRFEDEEEDEFDVDRFSGRNLKPHRGATVLTLGILGIVLGCGIILGPIAWIMGSNDLKEMRAGAMDPSGEGITRAGQILGIVATTLFIVVILFYGCFGVAMVALRR